MNRSEEIKQLAAALTKAQASMKPALKESENPFFKSHYADLASVWDAIRIPFTENGFSVSQFTETKDSQVRVTTLLLHVSGEWLSSELILPAMKLDPQAFGSALTYARRYALAAICGVATEDDDSESAMGRDKDKDKKPEPVNAKTKQKFPPAPPPEKPKKTLPTEAHKEAWKMLLNIFDKDTERVRLAIEEITQKQSLFACTEEEAQEIITRLTALQKEMIEMPDAQPEVL